MHIHTDSGHEIIPEVGTVKTLDGKPANLLKTLDYPVIAQCQKCGSLVRLERYFLADWYHVS